jgi:hypothetical protein
LFRLKRALAKEGVMASILRHLAEQLWADHLPTFARLKLFNFTNVICSINYFCQAGSWGRALGIWSGAMDQVEFDVRF